MSNQHTITLTPRMPYFHVINSSTVYFLQMTCNRVNHITGAVEPHYWKPDVGKAPMLPASSPEIHSSNSHFLPAIFWVIGFDRLILKTPSGRVKVR